MDPEKENLNLNINLKKRKMTNMEKKLFLETNWDECGEFED